MATEIKRPSSIINSRTPIIVKQKSIITFEEPSYQEIDWGNNYSERFSGRRRMRRCIAKKVLERSNASRNNDRILDLECMKTEFNEIKISNNKNQVIIIIPKSLLKKLPPLEDYKRARQALNQEGIGLPTDENVIRRRRRYDHTIKSYFRGNKDE